jgi:hypothetical protein
VASSQFRQLRLSSDERDKFGRIQTLSEIRALNPDTFERFVGYLYKKDGHRVRIAPIGPDGGIDLITTKDRKKTIVQCKRWNANNVGVSIAHALYGVASSERADDVALVVSGAVTAATRDFAENTPTPIKIIDGPVLEQWAQRVNQPQPDRFAFLSAITRKDALLFGSLIGIVLLLLLGLWIVRANNNSLGIGGSIAQLSTPVYPTLTPLPTGDPGLIAPTPTPLPPTPTPDLRNVSATYMDVPPTIDGNLEEWHSFPGVQSEYLVYSNSADESHQGTLSVTWYTGWDETNFYLAAHVLDDVHVQTRAGRNVFLGDSVEFQIDTDGGDAGTIANSDDYIILLSPGNFSNIDASAYCLRATANGEYEEELRLTIDVKATKTDDGYTLEAALTWSTLEFTPSAGNVVGIALNASDNDVPGTARQEALYSHVPDREYLEPATWGTLTLQ